MAFFILLISALPMLGQSTNQVIAIVGGTIMDGKGGQPILDGVLINTGKTISSVGTRNDTGIPANARFIEARGKFVTPGFIDTNVHLSLYGYPNRRFFYRHAEDARTSSRN